MDQVTKGRQFRDLHDSGTFVIVNAWDAGSAALFEAAGAPAIATTSSGVSWSLGRADGENLSRDEMLGAITKIASSVDVPVTGDVEAGYGRRDDDVAATISAVLTAGAVGCNIEDRDRQNPAQLWSTDEHVRRLSVARSVADNSGVPFTLNARTDVFLVPGGDDASRITETLERGHRYAEAGADCLFVPGVTDPATISKLVDESPIPINILMTETKSPSIDKLVSLGVRRVSVGGLIAAVAYRAARDSATELLRRNSSSLATALSHGELNSLMSSKDRSVRPA